MAVEESSLNGKGYFGTLHVVGNAHIKNAIFYGPDSSLDGSFKWKNGDTLQLNTGSTISFGIENVSPKALNVFNDNSWKTAKPTKILSDLVEFKDILDPAKDVGFKLTETSILRQTRKADLNKQKVAGMEFGLDGDLEDKVEVTVDKDAGTKTIKEIKTGISVTYPIEKQHSLKIEGPDGNMKWVPVTEDIFTEVVSNPEKWGDVSYKSSVKPEQVTDIKDANIVISLVHGKTDLHAPVLDLDFPHLYVDGELIINDPSVQTALIHEYLTDIELVSTPYHEGIIPLDFPHHYITSSTPGHGHLYIDVEMVNEDFWDFIQFLSDTKFIESGYCSASKARGYSALRLPWIKKEV